MIEKQRTVSACLCHTKMAEEVVTRERNDNSRCKAQSGHLCMSGCVRILTEGFLEGLSSLDEDDVLDLSRIFLWDSTIDLIVLNSRYSLLGS